MTATTANLWTVAGLVYALAGASLLALSVFSLPQPAMTQPQRTLQQSIGQWLDGRIGAALILAGFFFQMTGAVGTPSLNTPAVLVLLALAMAAAYYGLSKDLLIDKIAARADQASVSPELPATVAELEPPPPPVVLAPAEVIVVESETVVVDLRREGTG